MDIFTCFERSLFPESECTIPNTREPEVTNSDSVYLCVVVDDRFQDSVKLEYLRPYTAVDCHDKSVLLYGWACIGTDGYEDHCERAIRGNHERVVAWKKVDASLDVRDVFNVPHGR